MQDNEAKYREHLKRTQNLIVAFFECSDEFPRALEDVRRHLETNGIQPDKGCILYRTKCGADESPRWRIWSQLVPFEALTFSEEPHPPWLGLDRRLKRPMTEQECQDFLRERRYEVLELRVSRRQSTLRCSPPG
jgi:hypothetical protein